MGTDLHFKISGEWREDLRSVARGLRAMTLRHPWMAVHGTGRRNLGPNTARRYEQVLGAIDGLGLEIDEMLVMIERSMPSSVVAQSRTSPSRRPSVAPASAKRNGCKPRPPTCRA